ncbi:ABC transporter ATP-binding protein [Nibricoccus sp. IMCC34717]|uniref:ABC transporter ATP-binding protein n=1 Tax=Nibricoccus sp. IMCC34717 TaxID=3034021 RepID=UPI00384DEB84
MFGRFKPYLHYLRPHRSLITWSIVCGLIAGVAYGAGLPVMIKKVFPVVFAQTGRTLTTWEVIGVALWMPAVFVFRGVAGYINAYLVQAIGTRVLEAIRIDYFRKLQRLPLGFFHRHNSGDLMSRGLSDANVLQNTLTVAANEIIKSPATLVAALTWVAFLAYREHGAALVLATLGIVPLSVFPIRFVGRKLRKRSVHIQAELGAVSARFGENLSAAREIRAMGLEQRETDRFAAVSRALVAAQMSFAKYDKALAPLIEIVSAVGVAVTFVYAYRVQISQEIFLSLVTALFTCYEPIKKLGSLNSEFKKGLGALDRLEEVFNAPLEIEDAVSPVTVGRLRGEVSFSGVSFAYKAGEPVLRDVSVTLPPGTVAALVGPSGAGKTTFANLVPRFYDPTTGNVAIDGIDLRQMRVADLRRNIALVSQEAVLFNDTLLANIRLGRPDATDAEVEQAARDAFAHDFILAQPHGYQTVVGERGGKLSGGQRQRIALARAFLRNAPLLILDEATSALDSDSEAAIQAALKKLVVGKTVLIIAHRFSTIRDVDRILVFEEGRLRGHGSHAELYGQDGLYRSLYDRQSQGMVAS